MTFSLSHRVKICNVTVKTSPKKRLFVILNWSWFYFLSKWNIPLEMCHNIVDKLQMNQNSFSHWSKCEEFMKIIRQKIKWQFLLSKTCFFYAVRKIRLPVEFPRRTTIFKAKFDSNGTGILRIIASIFEISWFRLIIFIQSTSFSPWFD